VLGNQDSAVTVLTRPWAALEWDLSIASRGKTSTPTVGPTQPLFISRTGDLPRRKAGGGGGREADLSFPSSAVHMAFFYTLCLEFHCASCS